MTDLDANPTPASVDPAEESSGEGPAPKEGDAAAAKFVGLLVAISCFFFDLPIWILHQGIFGSN